ncbi:MAG TPA: HAD family phosphatase [Gemmataceae bacterium]|jgi:beta-phosphoglucomutase
MSGKNGKAAIWDVDGTLVDTAELHFQAWQAVCREHGRDFTRNDFAATFGQRNPEIIRTLFGERFTEQEIADLGDRKEVLYRDTAKNGVELLPGARQLVHDLHRAGFAQAIGSSAPPANLELILRLTGIARYFTAIVSSEDTERGKPDPQVFLLAADRLGVSPPRCVVFEDAVAGVEAARAGGMKCVAVRCVGHHSEEKLRQAGADRVVETLERISAAEIVDMLTSD